MNAPTSTRESGLGINPAVLKWAREWRGKTLEEAADAVDKDPSVVSSWEHNIGSPTVNQARTLAKLYDRPFLEFFFDAPPVVPVPELVADYRMRSGVRGRKGNRELQLIQQWAEARRADAFGLSSDLGIELPEIPSRLFARLETDPEAVSDLSREALEFSIQEQIALTKDDARTLPTILRQRLEGVGVLTLRRSDLKKYDARGLTLAQLPLPVIVIQNEAATAQAFTIMHEFGHILLGQSGISGERVRENTKPPVEAWCDRFAASFLMPVSQVKALIGPNPVRPSRSIEDLELERIADIFRVSPHAMLIRLVQLGYVEEEFYWQVKKLEFDQRDREAKSFARSPYYGSRYRAMHGDLYTGLVLEAWSSGRITNHNAAEYLGIKRLSHLEDIRQRFRQE